jgi:hypothetical protein
MLLKWILSLKEEKQTQDTKEKSKIEKIFLLRLLQFKQ